MITWSKTVENKTSVDGESKGTVVQVKSTVAWGNVTSTPTTLAGYGITDAYTKAQSDARYLRKDQDDTTAFNLTVQNITQNGSVPAGVGSFGSQYLSGMLDTNFVTLADGESLVYDSATSKWLNTTISTGSVSVWGDIGGTLSNQTDLQTALDTKIGGTIASTRIAYGTGTDIIGGDSSFVYSGGKVGIGISSPSHKLSIGSGAGDTTSMLQINTADGDKIYLTSYGATGSRISLGASWATEYKAGQGLITEQGSHVFYTTSVSGYSAKMSIIANGNVGIGNIAPAYKLDVSGNARFTSTVTATNFIQT